MSDVNYCLLFFFFFFTYQQETKTDQFILFIQDLVHMQIDSFNTCLGDADKGRVHVFFLGGGQLGSFYLHLLGLVTSSSLPSSIQEVSSAAGISLHDNQQPQNRVKDFFTLKYCFNKLDVLQRKQFCLSSFLWEPKLFIFKYLAE